MSNNFLQIISISCQPLILVLIADSKSNTGQILNMEGELRPYLTKIQDALM